MLWRRNGVSNSSSFGSTIRLWKSRRYHLQGNEQNDEVAANPEHGETRRVCRGRKAQHADQAKRRTERDPQADQDDVNVRVAGAEYRAGGSGQQAEAVEIVTPGPGAQQQNDIGEEVAQNFRIRIYVFSGGEPEAAGPKVCEPEHQRAAQNEHDEAILNEIEEWQDEQVEANVAREYWIGRAELLAPNQAQESIPLVREREPETSGRCSRPKNEKWREPVRVGLRYLCKPGQNQKIEQHIGKYRNEGDREHRELGRKEPPENFLVAERAEPQQFGRQVDDFQEGNKKDSPEKRQAHGGNKQATPGAR